MCMVPTAIADIDGDGYNNCGLIGNDQPNTMHGGFGGTDSISGEGNGDTL